MDGDEFDDSFFDNFDEAPNSSKVVLRPYQIAAHEAVFRSWQDHRSTMLVLPTGCHVGSQLLPRPAGLPPVFARDVKRGTILTGWDGTARRVLATTHGFDELVSIVPRDGDPWQVNLDHVLTLGIVAPPGTGTSQMRLGSYFTVVDVTVRDWLERDDPAWRHLRDVGRLMVFGPDGSLRSTTPFSVVPCGRGDYFGFTVDADNRYVLPDGTLTHNCGKTLTAAAILRDRRREGRILWLAHRGELLEQAAEALAKRIGLSCEVEKAERRADRHTLFGISDVVVGSVQTLRGTRLASWRPDSFSTIVVDECFVTGTLVDTPDGPKPIESIKAGDEVWSWDESTGRISAGRVKAAWSRRAPERLVRVVAGSTATVCTEAHPFMTESGRWVCAGRLSRGDILISSRDASKLSIRLRRLWSGVREVSSPFHGVRLRAVLAGATGGSTTPMGWPVRAVRLARELGRQTSKRGKGAEAGVLLADVLEGVCGERFRADADGDEPTARLGSYEGSQPDARGGEPREDGSNTQGHRSRSQGSRWKRSRCDGATNDARNRAGMGHGIRHPDQTSAEQRVPDALQNRHCRSRDKDRDRNRRWLALLFGGAPTRRKENRVPDRARVESAEVLERGSDGRYESMCPDGLVWNLEVERTHTYLVNGCVVHNCHHAPAKTYRQILERFPDAKVLGLTATPDRGDGVAMGHVFTDCSFTYETRSAIRDGWLTPIVQKQVRVAEIDLSQVKTVRGDLDETELAKIMELEGALHGIASAIAQSREGRPVIVFCTSVEQSKELARIMNDYGIRSTQVDGATPQAIRAERLAQFQTREVDAIVNVGVLTEGFDAPLTACVAMARPTKSRSLYAQCLGRGLRPLDAPEVDASPELRRAAIAASRKPDCLVLDFVGNSGKHKLINPIDILAGKPLPPDVEERVRQLTEEGRPSEEALSQAEQEAIDRERAREEKRKRDAAIRAQVAMKSRTVDPFGATTDSLAPEHRATQAQLDYLANFVKPKDLEKLAPNLSKKAAWKLTDTLKKRRKEGLCTYGQARVLARAGLRIDVPMETASKIIDWLATHDWKPSTQMIERFGDTKGDGES